ncbi:uncharacterized protein LOC141572321 [Rhinolophus sinicus]|uniref:uncharacterized protein LOC141572321 n=1 Tax=Rhinolophus sinicus TaxID=89399 RepID=UPI003D7AAF86
MEQRKNYIRRLHSARRRAGRSQGRERGGASPGSSAPSGPSPPSSVGHPSPSLRGPRPYLWARGCRVRRVLGSSEVSLGRDQRRPATAGSPAEPLLMACRAQSSAAAATAAPSSQSSSRAPSRDAANALAPQPSSPPPPWHGRSRLQRRPARSRASGSQRRPAPGPGVAAAARQPTPRYQSRCDAGRVPGNFLPCREHPAPGPAARAVARRWGLSSGREKKSSHCFPTGPLRPLIRPPGGSAVGDRLGLVPSLPSLTMRGKPEASLRAAFDPLPQPSRGLKKQTAFLKADSYLYGKSARWKKRQQQTYRQGY